MGKLNIGFVLPQGAFYDAPNDPKDTVKFIEKTATKVEEYGFNSLWVIDHFIPFPIITDNNVLECWSLLSYLSTITNKVKLGSIVTCNLYRYPTVLAKMASTVDVISKGRLIFGIGACWYEEEFKQYGILFPRFKQRLEMLDEALQIIKNMWVYGSVKSEGKYYKVKEIINYLKPLQKPYPPILIGGVSKGILRIVAKHATLWNYMGPLEKINEKYRVIIDYCRKFSRKTCNIGKTYYAWLISGRDKSAVRRRLIKLSLKFLSKLIPTKCKIPFGDVKRFLRIGHDPNIMSQHLIGTFDIVLERLSLAETLRIQEIMLYIPLLKEEPQIFDEYLKNILEKVM